MTTQTNPILVATTSSQISEQVKGLAIRYQELAATAHRAAAACRDYDGTTQAEVACNEATQKLSQAAEGVDAYLISLADLGDNIRYSNLQQEETPVSDVGTEKVPE